MTLRSCEAVEPWGGGPRWRVAFDARFALHKGEPRMVIGVSGPGRALPPRSTRGTLVRCSIH